MPHFYKVTWVDDKGVSHVTSTSDPNELQGTVQKKYGVSSGVTKVEYGDARDERGPVWEAEKPVVEEPRVQPPVIHSTPAFYDLLGRHPSLKKIVEDKYIVVQPSKLRAVSQPERVLHPGVMGAGAPKPSVGYRNVNEEVAIDIWQTRQNIMVVESSPSGTMFNTESGRQISREDALTQLRQEEKNLQESRMNLRYYEHQNYVVSRDEQGNYVFIKPSKPSPTEEEYKPSAGGFVSFLTTGFRPTFGLTGPLSPEENVVVLKQEIQANEEHRIKLMQSGDWLGLGINVITSPIPMAFVTMGLGFGLESFAGTRFGSTVFGEVTLPKLLGGRTVYATPAATVSNVVGGVFVGASAGSIVSSINQFGFEAGKQGILASIVTFPMYKTAFDIGKNFYQKLPFELQGRSPYFTRYGAGGVEAVGVQKYFDVFGKRIYVGEFKPFAFRNFPKWESGPPSWEPYTGVQPVGIDYIKPIGQPEIVPIIWKGKIFATAGLATNWQPVIDNKMIVRLTPSIVPFGSFGYGIKENVVVKWQPDTGLKIHPAEIKTLDELFKIYHEDKITTSEYQHFREKLKAIEQEPIGKPSPIIKPSIKVEPKSWSPPPIKIDVSSKGIISTSWYGKKTISTGSGWQPKITGVKENLSTVVHPKPVVFRAYETHYFFVVFEHKPIVSISSKGVVRVKPSSKKTFTMKDIIKNDKELSEEFEGGITREGGKGVFTVQETKVVELETPEVKSVFESEDIFEPVGPRTGVKEIYKTKGESLGKNIFKELGESEGLLPVRQTSQGSGVLLFPIQGMSRSQKVGVATSVRIGQINKQQQLNISAVGSFKAIGFDSDLRFKNIFDFDKVSVKTINRSTSDFPVIDQLVPSEPVEKVPSSSKRKHFDFSGDFVEKVQFGEPVYHVKVKPRQYVDGEKVSKGVPYRITSKPLRYFDALAFGADKIEDTAKASFILEETTGKPGETPSRMKHWSDVMIHYEDKGDSRFVEKNTFRIDSPGEIREISMRGWKAPHHKKNKRRIR